MILSSFRLKIALLSGLLTGALLVAFGTALWRISYQFNLDRLDRELRNLGHANLERVVGGDHWQRLESALKFVSGGDRPGSYVFWVKNYDKVMYESPGWPRALDPESFSIPTRYEVPGVVKLGKPLPPPPRRDEAISPDNPALPRKVAEFYTRPANGKVWRVGVLGNPYVTLILAADLGDFSRRLTELRNTFLAALPVALLLVAGGGWLVARRALRPVTALTQTAERMTAHGLDQRIPAMTRDQEFNRLITVFNEMMSRLEKSFSQATRFSADASHELKTPLARLQVELEQALENAPSGSPQQEVYSSLLDEISRLKAIVQKLLLLSLADAGRLQLHRAPVNLTRMVENVIEDCRLLAPYLAVEHQVMPEANVRADADLLEQALQNLASNAVKYNHDGGGIRFELTAKAERLLVRVSNTGSSIPPADRERIFERFYRSDRSRSGRIEGVGLGLSLSREILRAHGGDLVLEPTDAPLTVFTAWLPSISGVNTPCHQPKDA
jgi:two-component system, OmpR family, heavy metal sensor histidine kinase CusS